MSSRTKLSSKGQVTIPNEIRKAKKMEEGDYLIFETKSEYEPSVRVIKTKPLSSLLGALPAKSKDAEISEIRKKAYLYMTENKSTKD